MPTPARRTMLVLAALTVALLCFGCSKKEGGTTKPVVYSNASLRAADSVLALVLMSELNSDPQRPADIDLNAPYSLYNAALADPGLSAEDRQRARFGVAVLTMLILSSDAEVNAAFDEWAAYLQSRVPFEVPPPPGPRNALGIPAGLASGRRALGLPFDVVPRSLLAHLPVSLGAADPQIGRVQAILRDRALPRLAEAIAHLAVIGADPTFRFIVTPEMQGDPLVPPVEVDRTDALALKAACRLLASACHVAVSYRLNFPAYDEVSLLAAIQPGSGWLALLPDGASHMGAARTELVGSVDDVDAAISSLVSETDNQDDDVIRVGPGDLAQADLDSIRTRLGQVRQGLNGSFTLTANWDGNGGTPDVPLTINVRALFDSPVNDWKALLPGYAGTVTERPFDRYWVYNYVQDKAVFTIATGRLYSGYYSLGDSAGQPQEFFSGDAEIVTGLRTMMLARFASALAAPGYVGGYYGSTSFYGSLSPGPHSSLLTVWESYSIASRFVHVPVITWNATQYSEWTWPDPTFDGLLPGVTTTNQLLTTFGYNPASWERVVVLDWTGSAWSSAKTALPRDASARSMRP